MGVWMRQTLLFARDGKELTLTGGTLGKGEGYNTYLISLVFHCFLIALKSMYIRLMFVCGLQLV